MSKLKTHRNNTVSNAIHYYSFYIGEMGSNKSTWVLEDLKMPASSIKQAVIFHINLFNKKKLVEPSPFMLGRYRLIVEYELVSVRGSTIMQYRKLKVHTGFSVCSQF